MCCLVSFGGGAADKVGPAMSTAGVRVPDDARPSGEPQEA